MSGKQFPRAAVVIAAYNSAAFLNEAVESVLAQSISDWELVVVDDGSEDETPAVMQRYLTDKRVRYVWQENGGQARAKNRGIAETVAPIVGFCDADDRWHPSKLERQLPAFARPEVGVVYGRVQRFGSAGELLPDTTERRASGRVTEDLFVSNFVPFGTAMVRRAFVEKHGAFNEQYRMGIDWDLWLRLSLDSEFAFVDEVVYYYRVWQGQMSSNWRGRYEHAIRIMEDFLRAHPDAVSARVRRRGFADTLVNRAQARAEKGGEFSAALEDVLDAIRFDPAYWKVWYSVPWLVRAYLLSRGRSASKGSRGL